MRPALLLTTGLVRESGSGQTGDRLFHPSAFLFLFSFSFPLSSHLSSFPVRQAFAEAQAKVKAEERSTERAAKRARIDSIEALRLRLDSRAGMLLMDGKVAQVAMLPSISVHGDM